MRAAATIAQLYVEHLLPCRDIGQRLGLSTFSIEQALKRRGIPRRQPGPDMSRQQIDEMIAEGTPPATIAEQHQCSKAAVYRAMKRSGLQTQREVRRQSAHDRTTKLRNDLTQFGTPVNSPKQQLPPSADHSSSME